MPDADANPDQVSAAEFKEAMQKLGKRLGVKRDAGMQATTQDPYGKAHEDPFSAIVREVNEGLVGELPLPDEQQIKENHIIWFWNVNNEIVIRGTLYTTDNPEAIIAGKAGHYFVDALTGMSNVGGVIRFTNIVGFSSSERISLPLEDSLKFGKALMSAWAWRANWKKHMADLLIQSQQKKPQTFTINESLPVGTVIQIEDSDENGNVFSNREDKCDGTGHPDDCPVHG